MSFFEELLGNAHEGFGWFMGADESEAAIAAAEADRGVGLAQAEAAGQAVVVVGGIVAAVALVWILTKK